MPLSATDVSVKRSQHQVFADIGWALNWAKGLVLFYALIAGAFYFVVTRTSDKAPSVPLVVVVVFYAVVGLISGLIVGFFRPYARRGPKYAAVVGTMAAVPAYGGAVLLLMQNKTLMPEPFAGLASIFVLAPLIGGTIGYRWFNLFHS